MYQLPASKYKKKVIIHRSDLYLLPYEAFLQALLIAFYLSITIGI